MPAPKGSKNALGNKGNVNAKGVPPETSDKELIELGEKMIAWFKKTPDAVFIQEFTITLEGYISAKQVYKWAEERKVFRKYYDTVKEICGTRQAKFAGKESGLHSSIANRFLTHYFDDLKDHEKEMKAEEAQKLVEVIQHVHNPKAFPTP